jgi:hypothetical protein
VGSAVGSAITTGTVRFACSLQEDVSVISGSGQPVSQTVDSLCRGRDRLPVSINQQTVRKSVNWNWNFKFVVFAVGAGIGIC